MDKDLVKCDMTVGTSDNFYTCGKPAKYISPEKIMGKKYHLCRIHRKIVDRSYERINSDKRCKPLTSV